MSVKEENVHMIIFSCFYSYGLFSFEFCEMLCVEQAKNQSADPIQPQNSSQSWWNANFARFSAECHKWVPH